MLFEETALIEGRDVTQFSWASLRQFQNINFTANKIKKIHKILPKYEKNANKQAEQLRYCLIQAEEYFRAAESVTMATKPLLIYYGIVSLALAKILFKQSGMSSLDAARGQHAHHGLDFRLAGGPVIGASLEEVGANFRAVPLVKANDERFGTFALWHASSRNSPIVGNLTRNLENGASTKALNILAQVADVSPAPLREKGLSFLDCARQLPYLRSTLNMHGVKGSTARGTIDATVWENRGRSEYKIVIQPGDGDIIEKICEKFIFSPSMVPFAEISDMPSGYIISISELGEFSAPEAIQIKKDEVWFMHENENLNEFGHIYVCMFIIGNYARYYPEMWMKEIENSTPLFLLSQEIVHWSSRRMPLLCFGELNRTYYLN